MTDRRAKLEKMLEGDAQDAFLLYALAHEHAQAGEFEQAVERFDASLAAEPTYCYAYFHKAKCLSELGRADEAAAVARAGLARASAVGDVQAANELRALVEEFSPQQESTP